MIFLFSKITYSKWANRQVNIALTIVVPIIASNLIIVGAVFSIIGMHNAKITAGNTTYFYSTDKIDITLDDLGVDKPTNFLYEETSHDKAKSFLATKEEYGDYCYKDEISYGYSIEIFSSKYKSIMNKYNKLVIEDERYTFNQLADTKNNWSCKQVFYGSNEQVSMYVVVGDGVTFVITGDLNVVQAAELSSFYMNK